MKFIYLPSKSSRSSSRSGGAKEAQEAKVITEAPSKIPFARSSTQETLESASTTSDAASVVTGSSTLTGSSIATKMSFVESIDDLPDAGVENAIDPCLRPTTLEITRKRLAKISKMQMHAREAHLEMTRKHLAKMQMEEREAQKAEEASHAIVGDWVILKSSTGKNLCSIQIHERSSVANASDSDSQSDSDSCSDIDSDSNSDSEIASLQSSVAQEIPSVGWIEL